MGDKSGQVAPEKPVEFLTNTLVGDAEGPGRTFKSDDVKNKRESISTKRKGTRGLQIPLEADVSTTTGSPATTGVQI